MTYHELQLNIYFTHKFYIEGITFSRVVSQNKVLRYFINAMILNVNRYYRFYAHELLLKEPVDAHV